MYNMTVWQRVQKLPGHMGLIHKNSSTFTPAFHFLSLDMTKTNSLMQRQPIQFVKTLIYFSFPVNVYLFHCLNKLLSNSSSVNK